MRNTPRSYWFAVGTDLKIIRVLSRSKDKESPRRFALRYYHVAYEIKELGRIIRNLFKPPRPKKPRELTPFEIMMSHITINNQIGRDLVPQKDISK